MAGCMPTRPVRYIDSDGRYTWEQFKADVKPAFNLDFGRDYIQFAIDAWNNGQYFTAAIYELDAACEMVYDLYACYAAAEFVGGAVTAASGATSSAVGGGTSVYTATEPGKKIDVWTLDKFARG